MIDPGYEPKLPQDDVPPPTESESKPYFYAYQGTENNESQKLLEITNKNSWSKFTKSIYELFKDFATVRVFEAYENNSFGLCAVKYGEYLYHGFVINLADDSFYMI